MLLKYFYDPVLAHASYMIGCAATGEALVVDPSRDVQHYLDAAASEGVTITHVAETHIQADFVSGSLELAVRAGAQVYLSGEGDAYTTYEFPDSLKIRLLHEGDSWMVGNVRVEVLHTPGHTPEHLAFMITDTAATDIPIGIFTGDFLFVGSVGRPDLLEKVVGASGTTDSAARQQFANIQRFKALPDYLQLWPSHGAGSACGKSLGAIPSTTLGYEKRVNPAFQIDDEAEFVVWLMDGQPEAPRYFAQDKQLNKTGPTLLSHLPHPPHLDGGKLPALLEKGAFVVDFRFKEDFARKHIKHTVNIPLDSRFTTYVGWFVDFNQPFYFITPDERATSYIMTMLRRIGVDQIGGYFIPDTLFSGDIAPEHVNALETFTAPELVARMQADPPVILDVRGTDEYEEAHLPGVKHIPLGDVLARSDEIPRDQVVVIHCEAGYRAQVAASLLRRQGFANVFSVNDTFDNLSQAWDSLRQLRA